MSPWTGLRRGIIRRRISASWRRPRYRPALQALDERCLPSGGYSQINLASDVPGLAPVTDSRMVNPWGMSNSPTGPFWFAENGGGVSDILDGRGRPFSLVVALGDKSGTPTGTVFNESPGFVVSANGVSAPSRFLFATEAGVIAGWTRVVDPARAVTAVDNSSSGAVYKGLALDTDSTGRRFLYAADFHGGRIDVFDQDLKPVLRAGAFQDSAIPDGYAPFNIQNISGLLFVTYARQAAIGADEVDGRGNGFIDVYQPEGTLVRRFASRGALNSPWGLALAPSDFGPFGGALLVGNTGDGRINAYDPTSGAFLGTLTDDSGPITIPNLWSITFGNGHLGGAADTLFFTAGIDDEEHGLFGAIQTPHRKGADTGGSGVFDPHAPGEPGDYPLPPRDGPPIQDRQDGTHLTTAVLLPLTESSLALSPTLATGSLAGLGRDGMLFEIARPASQDASNGGPRQIDTKFASQSAGGLNQCASPESKLFEPGGARKVDLPNIQNAGNTDQRTSRDVYPTISLLDDREARSISQLASESPAQVTVEGTALVRDCSERGPEEVGDTTSWIKCAKTDDGGRRMDLLSRFLAASSVTVFYVVLRKVRSTLSRSTDKANWSRPLFRH